MKPPRLRRSSVRFSIHLFIESAGRHSKISPLGSWSLYIFSGLKGWISSKALIGAISLDPVMIQKLWYWTHSRDCWWGSWPIFVSDSPLITLVGEFSPYLVPASSHSPTSPLLLLTWCVLLIKGDTRHVASSSHIKGVSPAFTVPVVCSMTWQVKTVVENLSLLMVIHYSSAHMSVRF